MNDTKNYFYGTKERAAKYQEQFDRCVATKGHRPQMMIYEKGEYKYWHALASGHCSNCGCFVTQKVVGDVCTIIWINPSSFGIMEIKEIKLSELEHLVRN